MVFIAMAVCLPISFFSLPTDLPLPVPQLVKQNEDGWIMVFHDYFLGSQQGSRGIPFHGSSQLQAHRNELFLLWKGILCSWRGERSVFFLPELYKCKLLILLFCCKDRCCLLLPTSPLWRGGEGSVVGMECSYVQFRDLECSCEEGKVCSRRAFCWGIEMQ